MKTLQEHAQLVLAIQDACNAHAVAIALEQWFKDYRDLASSAFSTDARNQHPITVLYVDKLASLARCQAHHDRITEAYAEVQRLKEGPTDGTV